MQYQNRRAHTVSEIKAMEEILFNMFEEVMAGDGTTMQEISAAIEERGDDIPDSSIKRNLFDLIGDHRLARDIAEKAKTIIFSVEQAKIFTALSGSYTESLEYTLPYQNLFLQFSAPIVLNRPIGGCKFATGLLLGQHVVTKEQRVVANSEANHYTRMLGLDEREIVPINSYAVKNHCYAVLESGNVFQATWEYKPEGTECFETDPEMVNEQTYYRNLAIACIGYINCENIYLLQEGGAPDKVNRKRAQQGKKILEPYYVCRIRGVQYDSNGQPTGEGTHHGFRYDVRGHFRKLTSGKTTWVRPHQRGLQNELYIPKTYVVEKRAKPMTQPHPAPPAARRVQEGS